MKKWEKGLLISIWIVALLAGTALVPLPHYAVHKVNKCCSSNECALEHHHDKTN